MAILRSIEGKFYDVPDSDLSKLELSEDKVKELMESGGPAGPEGDVEPYGARRRRGGFCWKNWRNCYCWRNCY